MRSLQCPGRSPVLAPEGVASTSHRLSKKAAVNILQNSGNMKDAALAACAVQVYVKLESTGIDGDCFCLYSEDRSNKLRDGLRTFGHNIRPSVKPIGGSQAIFVDWDTSLPHAGSDLRKDGCAIGY